MENQIIDIVLSLFYHIINEMKGEDAVQMFIIINFYWICIVFFLMRKYHKIIDKLLEITENQDKILEQIDKRLLEQEHKRELLKLISENEQLKINNKVNLELIKQLKKKK